MADLLIHAGFALASLSYAWLAEWVGRRWRIPGLVALALVASLTAMVVAILSWLQDTGEFISPQVQLSGGQNLIVMMLTALAFVLPPVGLVTGATAGLRALRTSRWIQRIVGAAVCFTGIFVGFFAVLIVGIMIYRDGP